MEGWPASYLRNYLNSDLMEILPEDLKKIIIETKVISGHGPTEGEENFTTYDKIYPLSVVELYGENNSSDTVKLNETRQLDYYHLNNVSLTNYSFLKKLETENHYYDWYLRSPSSTNLNGILIVTSAGRLLVTYPSNYAGISPAFRIG